MKFTKEELSKMDFNDPFELEESDEEEDEDEDEEGSEDCCIVCGNIFTNLKIGYNAKEEMFRYECANCDSVYVAKGTQTGVEMILLKGEHRNWPDYLMEKLKFPFDVVITEESDKAFFIDDYDGPRRWNKAKVLDVFYSFKYGVEALIRIGRKKHLHILAWVEVADGNSSNYIEVENYKRWRERHWLSDYVAAVIDAFGKGDDSNDEDDEDE